MIGDNRKANDMTKLRFAVHPGRILRDEFLTPFGLSAGALAEHVGVPRTRIERLVNEQTSMTVDTAMRLAAAFGTTPNFWVNLQTAYDLSKTDIKDFRGIEPLAMAG